MIQLDLEVDWTEVDGAINRLITAIQPNHIHSLAAKTTWKQVKTKYPQRWRSQVNVNSIWQQVKQEIQGQGKGFGSFLTGLGFAAKPGFLTGTTYKSITAEYDNRRGRVYPKGRWPQDPDCADLPSEYTDKEGQSKTGAVKYFKWGDDGLEFYLGPGYQRKLEGDQASPSYRRDERMVNKEYYADWLFLDSEDIDLVMANVSSLLDSAMENNRAGITSLYRSVRFKDTPVTLEQAKEEVYGSVEQEPQHIPYDINYNAHVDRYYDFMQDLIDEQESTIQELIKNER